MASADNSVVLLKSLLDAVRNDDVQSLKILLSTNPGILDLAAKSWPENPLIAVCKMRSFRLVEEIRNLKPELASLKDDKDGCTLLHLACIRGDVEMVKVLVGLDSRLCFVQGMLSMIPLHTAAVHGRVDVIRELLLARPESLGALTSLDETAFHLAAKNHQSDAFAFLFEEAKKVDQKHLVYDAPDYQGFTPFEIAIGNKVFHPNLMSESGMLDDIPEASNALEIVRIPHEAPVGHEVHTFSEVITLDELHRSRRWLLEKRKFMVIFPALLLGLGFSITLILPYFFPREKYVSNQVVFQFRDVVVTRELPPVFYIMTFITIVLTTSSINLTVLLLSLPYGSFLFLCGISTFALYVLLTYCIMPKFFVRIGSDDVSSFQTMWSLALGLVFLGAIVFVLAKYCFRKPIRRMKILLRAVLLFLCFRLTAVLSFLCFRVKVILSYLWFRVMLLRTPRRISYNIVSLQ